MLNKKIILLNTKIKYINYFSIYLILVNKLMNNKLKIYLYKKIIIYLLKILNKCKIILFIKENK
jgi:hypothetical protein